MPPKFKRGDPSDSRPNDPERQGLLESQSDDEEFFSRGQSVRTHDFGRDMQLQRVQGQVDEVVGVMKNNITKVMERGDRLDELQDKSDGLASQADYFRSTARGLRTQMWWRECKMRILLAVVVVIILLIIIIPIIIKHTR